MRLTQPSLDSAELEAIAEVLESGYLTQGPRASEFERAVADYVGSAHGIATSSCTTALHLALVALGVGPGDEVIVPDFTFPATANVVLQQGAIPVLVDVLPGTFNLDPAQLPSVVSERTRAILPVHAFGLCADMAPILEFAAERSLPVIEDAACALGATYHGVHAGSLGDVACFSFHPRKIITTGEGGLITTQDPALASKLRLLCSHGGSPRELYLEFIAAGYNYRLSDINAAVGIVQMKKLEDLLLKRRTIAIRYLAILGDVAGISLPSEPVGLRHTYQSFVILLDSGLDRDSVIRHMRSKGVEVTLGTYSLSCQPAYGGKASTRRTSLSRSQRAFHSSLTLPLFPQMTMDQVDEVCEVLRQSLAMAAK